MDQLGSLWKNTPIAVDTSSLIYILIGLSILTFAIIYGSYRYQRFKKYQEFEQEMNLLELDQLEESTLSEMVLRFALQEPVQVLVSKRTFDEMAAREIQRILGSPGSMKAKQEFINTLYEIRKKTYHKDWLDSGATDELVQVSVPAPAAIAEEKPVFE